MEPVGEAPYRAAWVDIFRQFSFATSMRYVVIASLLGSFAGFVPRAWLQGAAGLSAIVSLVAQALIRCPRCEALWPLTSDDNGQRKPCKQCHLRWGQEEDDQPELEPMDPNAF